MNKIKLKIIIVLIIISSLLLVFHRNLIKYYYKYEASQILKEKHNNIKIIKIKVGKTLSLLGYSYPICKVDYKYKNDTYMAIININDNQIYDNYQYKEIYNDLSKEITSKFGVKYKHFGLDYDSEIKFSIPESFYNLFDDWQYNNFINGHYDGTNINELINEGTIILEFTAIDTPYKKIESFINKYNDKFDINITTEKEITINNKNPNSKCITKNIYSNTIDKIIQTGDNCYRDINNLRINSEKTVVDNINIYKIPAFEFSYNDYLNNIDYYSQDFNKEYEEILKKSKYKIISDFYKIDNNFNDYTVGVTIKGNFDPNKKYLAIIEEFGDYPNIIFENVEVTPTGITINFMYPKNVGFAILELEN